MGGMQPRGVPAPMGGMQPRGMAPQSARPAFQQQAAPQQRAPPATMQPAGRPGMGRGPAPMGGMSSSMKVDRKGSFVRSSADSPASV